MRIFTSLVLLALRAAALSGLSACAATPAPPLAPSPAPLAESSPGNCRAGGAQFAVGRSVDTALEAQARTRAGAGTVRTLRPGQNVTKEFNAQRLNLEVDAVGRVVQVRCG